MQIVVVESPAKARTIEKYLGSEYKVLATYGHVCDLPSKDGSVRPDDDFAMDYVTDPKSKKHLNAIAGAVKTADKLLLATDPDREGEAISWHVLNYLRDSRKLGDIDVGRIVFHEITREAVLDAVAQPRDLDIDLINAQQARRALDYLVGFTLSPVLWRKLPGSRSAGRVQSVALRLICAREQEIESFVAREYWSVETELGTESGAAVVARLTHLNGDKLGKFDLPDKTAADAAVNAIEQRQFAVAKVERKQVSRNPSPPFTTSTLQQEASRKLSFGARRTMEVAQRLYEGIDIDGETVGLITYMRTDSVALAKDAQEACRNVITQDFGANYVPDLPRRYRTRAKNAQEAHEAIRPTDPGRRPAAMAKFLGRDEARLYELIWKRTMASQMASAKIDQVAADFASPDNAVTLRANGSTIAFDGFLRIYREGVDDSSDDDNDDRTLPPLSEAQPVTRGAVTPEQHFTEPPPRYTEATLVKRLEELGIGRPSTYASIISVLQDRDYVKLDKRRFVPESRGRLVTVFLESFFERYVRYDFTADLEDQLDRISNGELDWKDVLREFWSAFSMAVDDISELRVKEVLDRLDEVLGPHIFQSDDPNVDPRTCPSCDDGRLNLKVGKFGAFVGCSNYPECRFTRQLTQMTNGAGTEAAAGPKTLGAAPDGGVITLRIGPYGPYLQIDQPDSDEKPKRVSVPKGLDPASIELDMAIALLSLPRDVGTHPETGKSIKAGIGRFGPYVNHDGKYASLPDIEELFSVGVNRAVALLSEARGGRGRATPLHVLGEHPSEGGEVAVYTGRYGPYVKHKSILATLPKSVAPDAVTMEMAVPLLAEKAAKKKGAKGARGKTKKATKAKTAKAATAAKSKAGGRKRTTKSEATSAAPAEPD